MDKAQTLTWNDYINSKFIQSIKNLTKPEDCEILKSAFSKLEITDPNTLNSLINIIKNNKNFTRNTKTKVEQIALQFFHYKTQGQITQIERCKKNFKDLSIKKNTSQSGWEGTLQEWTKFKQISPKDDIDQSISSMYPFIKETIEEDPKTLNNWTNTWELLVRQYFDHHKDNNKFLLSDFVKKLTKLFTKDHFSINFMPVITQLSFTGYVKNASQHIKNLLSEHIENPGKLILLFISEFPEFDGGDELYIFSVELPSVKLNESGEKKYFVKDLQIDRPTAFIEVYTISETDKKSVYTLDQPNGQKGITPSQKVIKSYGSGIIPKLIFNVSYLNEIKDKNILNIDKFNPTIDSQPVLKQKENLANKKPPAPQQTKCNKQNVFEKLASTGNTPKYIPIVIPDKKPTNQKTFEEKLNKKFKLIPNINISYSKPILHENTYSVTLTVTGKGINSISAEGKGTKEEEARENAARNLLEGKFININNKQNSQTENTKKNKKKTNENESTSDLKKQGPKPSLSNEKQTKNKPPVNEAPKAENQPAREPSILFDVKLPENFIEKPDNLTESSLLQLGKQPNESKTPTVFQDVNNLVSDAFDRPNQEVNLANQLIERSITNETRKKFQITAVNPENPIIRTNVFEGCGVFTSNQKILVNPMIQKANQDLFFEDIPNEPTIEEIYTELVNGKTFVCVKHFQGEKQIQTLHDHEKQKEHLQQELNQIEKNEFSDTSLATIQNLEFSEKSNSETKIFKKVNYMKISLNPPQNPNESEEIRSRIITKVDQSQGLDFIRVVGENGTTSFKVRHFGGIATERKIEKLQIEISILSSKIADLKKQKEQKDRIEEIA